MKRLFFVPILCSALILSCSSTEKTYKVGLVNFVSGKAFIIGANGKEVPAKPGMPIDISMKVKTIGAKSLCEIYFNDNAIKVFGDSTVAIEWLTYNKKTESDESVLVLNNGRFFARVKHKLTKDDTFIIKTPTCVAAVRGTEFFVSDNGNNSNVSCLDGKVEVRDRNKKGKPAIINEKEEASTVKGKATQKKAINEKNMAALQKESDIKPATENNQRLFTKLDNGDSSAVKYVKKSVEITSGSTPDKSKKPDIDILFFQR
jgi:hypothetical protein